MTLLGQQPPPPPQGPGVFPPFPAPPVEGRGRRVGLGLGLGAGVLVLVCGGGVAAAVGLTTVMTSALNEQAEVVVGDYLDALRDREWSQAYDQLCDEAKGEESESQFISRVSTGEPITSWDVGEVELVRLSAPVAVTYADGDTADLRAYLGQDRQTGGFEVCSVEE
ncbi:hypothetical protein GCM10020358_51680 [Amorphoplanes nipponensis]|uniref:DUF3887 domain-containing protein n=1 Tax=Actinoplanes nipponensis TaxID=135950 RepID=A0A919JKN4_9ACTN|nr:hypothetical protein [Actinoplanes nipponensis]GIE50926.1 hypothetical protein Ani05nite_44600 [Actinoplanes nipponensis]